MFGKNKRQIKDVTFVQTLKGEAYFYTPIAYSTNSQNSGDKQVFTDSDLALAGKLKLIFEREKMTWFEIREEKQKKSLNDERLFALYYFPHRLVASRVSPFSEKATLQDIKKLFDFFVTEDQTRFAEVQPMQAPTAYGFLSADACEEPEPVSLVAGEPNRESEAVLSVKQVKR